MYMYIFVCLFTTECNSDRRRESPVRVRACVRASDDIDEHTHVAVSRKCRRLVLDGAAAAALGHKLQNKKVPF